MCVCICVDTGRQSPTLPFMTPQILPTFLFLSETGSLTSLEFAAFPPLRLKANTTISNSFLMWVLGDQT